VDYDSTGPGSGEVFKVVAVDETPVLSQLEFSDNQFDFLVGGATGRQYVVEVSGNLLNWTEIITNSAPFTNIETAVTGFPYRFYRARYQP
jgi:hypothetical protein